MGRLDGLTAVVTGASRGIGLAIAKAFLNDGARVCLTATRSVNLNNAIRELEEFDGHYLTAGYDVSDQTAVAAALKKIEEQWGKIDILVNNAAIYKAAPFLEYEVSDFEHAISVNYFGVLYSTRTVLPGMIKRGLPDSSRGRRRIVLSSTSSIDPI